jgi:hypothetical protein
MPTFDGGHYFLTALIPVREDLYVDHARGSRVLSHVHALREMLAALPAQNPLPTLGGLVRSPDVPEAPFSRDGRTHFARLVVVDDVAYNGRVHEDAIRTAITRNNPVVPQHVDHLPFSFLAFLVDFDAENSSDGILIDYLEGLWNVMSNELIAILQHCKGFDPQNGRQSFVELVTRCQLETTMSFNDYYWRGESGYWMGSPSLKGKLRGILMLPLLATGSLLLILALNGLRGWTFLLVLLLLLAVSVYWIYLRVLATGRQPFPTAPRTDLKSVLKALYLQQQFIRFMVAQQGASDKELHQAFGSFLSSHQPGDTSTPSQPAGTLPH